VEFEIKVLLESRGYVISIILVRGDTIGAGKGVVLRAGTVPKSTGTLARVISTTTGA
jgi:hypothetical protein